MTDITRRDKKRGPVFEVRFRLSRREYRTKTFAREDQASKFREEIDRARAHVHVASRDPEVLAYEIEMLAARISSLTAK